MTGIVSFSDEAKKERSLQCKARGYLSALFFFFPVVCKTELLKQIFPHVDYIHFT